MVWLDKLVGLMTTHVQHHFYKYIKCSQYRYSILKPPKTGNCKILNTNTSKISIGDLKTVCNNKITNNKKRKDDFLKIEIGFAGYTGNQHRQCF